jgi:Na+/H+ antiporter NhaD/arsenite permease-like protein
MKKNSVYLAVLAFIISFPYGFMLVTRQHPDSIAGIDVEFVLFGLILTTITLFHKFTLPTALTGLFSVVLYKIVVKDFPMLEHLNHEKMILINLFGLLLGFALLARHFAESGLPKMLPRWLPNDWKGPLMLLVFVFLLSSFLDNIAAAMIGGTIAMVVFDRKVHIGYVAAIVAASNAGGSGSVIGDTTTTMMWIGGVPASKVVIAYAAAFPALAIFGYFASRQQDRYQRIRSEAPAGLKIDYKKIAIVVMILAGAILTNILFELPALGVWIGLGLGALFSKTSWEELPGALKSSLFLLSLVFIASLMPVEDLPEASWKSSFTLGFVSSFFDNIPLTKLALSQDNYDWGILAFSVGFGGSMIWFGSSAGVAISNIFREARSVILWVKGGWHILLAFVAGFFIMYLVVGWHPYHTGSAEEARPAIENTRSQPGSAK